MSVYYEIDARLYCFLLTGKMYLTEKEKDEGAKLLWETPEKALELIAECFDKLVASKYESIYSTFLY